MFTVDRGLRATAGWLKVVIKSGYRAEYWGLGEIEVSALELEVFNESAVPPFLVGTGKDAVHLLVVMTAERGLCGAFNANVLKAGMALLALVYVLAFLNDLGGAPH